MYVVEHGLDTPEPVRALDGYELASRLSFLFWGTVPDVELLAHAHGGTLAAPAELERQARRLMGDDRFLESAFSFHSQLFRIESLGLPGIVSKDVSKHPGFGDELKHSMLAEAHDFIGHVLGEAGGNVRALLTAPIAFPHGSLLGVYDLPDAPLSRFDISDGTRSGILTLPAVMAAVPAVPSRHQATFRGNLVRKELFCQVVAPPNVAVSFELPPNADQLSDQELLRVHKDNPSCAGCHELMDPIGFGFDNYDGLGHFATTGANGEPLDTSGYMRGTDVDQPFSGPRELAEKLAASPQVRACLSKQWFRFALARDPGDGDACSLLAVETTLQDGDGDIREALVSLVTSDAFRYRKGE